mmetsp:Transcript_4402/g.9496  ORF Transcript_4402/g.9496 Transcript_4402/m.9496 type:complete len:515 (+) Transcript_4402:253-1797(+)
MSTHNSGSRNMMAHFVSTACPVSPSEEARDWSSLPPGALHGVALLLDRPSVRSFLCCCSSWGSALSPAAAFHEHWLNHLAVRYRPDPVLKAGPLHADCSFDVEVTADARLAVCFGFNPTEDSPRCTVRVIDLQTGSLKSIFDLLCVQHFALSPDSRHVAAACCQDNIQFWDLESGVCTGTLVAPTPMVLSKVHYVLGGQQILTVCGAEQLRLWDVASMQCVSVLIEESAEIYGLTISANGCVAASAAAYDKAVVIWDLAHRAMRSRLTDHVNMITALELSADGASAAVALSDQSLRVWDTVSGQCLHVLMSSQSSMSAAAYSVAFSHDMRHLFTGHSNQSVRIWSLESGACAALLVGSHEGEVYEVKALPRGRYVISRKDAFTLRVWYLGSPAICAALSHSTAQPARSQPLIITPGEQELGQGVLPWRGGEVPGAGWLLQLPAEGGGCPPGTQALSQANRESGGVSLMHAVAHSRVLCSEDQGEMAVVAISPAGRYLICANDEGLCVWDVPTRL